MAIAGTSDDARFALHRKATTTNAVTIGTTYSPGAGAGLACNNFITQAPLGAYSLVSVVVGHGPTVGINGVSYGIHYVPADANVTLWTLCADLEFKNDGGNGDYPAPEGGIRATYVNCQNLNPGGFGTQAVIGALTCYGYTAAGHLDITPNNNLVSGPELAVADCGGSTTQLLEVFPPFAHYSLMGRVDFGGGSGLNPCLIVPAKETTWGKIKDLYNQ
jgi:hypothetical protein